MSGVWTMPGGLSAGILEIINYLKDEAKCMEKQD